MVQSNKGREIIAAIPFDRLLTETDAPFTYDDQIKDRISALTATIKGMAEIRNCSAIQLKESVYNNFKNLLL
jgi:TatD DNase family protein